MSAYRFHSLSLLVTLYSISCSPCNKDLVEFDQKQFVPLSCYELVAKSLNRLSAILLAPLHGLILLNFRYHASNLPEMAAGHTIWYLKVFVSLNRLWIDILVGYWFIIWEIFTALKLTVNPLGLFIFCAKCLKVGKLFKPFASRKNPPFVSNITKFSIACFWSGVALLRDSKTAKKSKRI